MTFPETALLTSTFVSGWTLPTSVTLTWMSATSALPTLTGSFGSCLLLAFAFMATNTPITATARTMMEMVANLRLRLDAVIPAHPLLLRITGEQAKGCSRLLQLAAADGRPMRAARGVPAARGGDLLDLLAIVAGLLGQRGDGESLGRGDVKD